MKLSANSILVFLFFVVSVLGQSPSNVLEVRNFTGLNTRAGDFQIQPNEARICHNVDLSRKLGSISKRYGYDSLLHVANVDSVVGLYGAYYSDGSQQMFYVYAMSNYDYGKIYTSNLGYVGSSVHIWPYFAIQNRPSFAMLADNVYIVNGSNKGVVCHKGANKTYARPYPLQAPGEPYIVPTTKSGPLNGEYRYIFRSTIYSNSGIDQSGSSIVSSPIIVKNGQILLTRFQFVPEDSFSIGIDSILILAYRTKANPGPLDLSDSAYWLGKYWWLKGSDIGSYIFIDSIADSDLTSASRPLVDNEMIGRDSTRNTQRCYGSPAFVSSYDGTGQDIFHGWPSGQKDTLGVAYVCTFIDTVTGIESDTGRSLFVFCDSGSHSPSYDRVHLNLPKMIDNDSGMMVNLYRADIHQITHADSAINYLPGSAYLKADPQPWKVWLEVDSFTVGNYHLVEQFNKDQTDYWDQTPYDSLINHRIYNKQTAPPLMKQIFSYQGRLFGIQKSGLYYSAPIYADTLQSWGAMSLTPINPDDGDMVTVAWPERGVIRVMKSYSNYNVYQDAALEWTKSEVSGYWGCVAPWSHAAGLDGHYYLSVQGVIREIEGSQLERTQQVELISAKIDNYDQYSIMELSTAQGFYFDRKYLLCIGDTTYVYDEKAKAWSTWGFPFSRATLYSKETERLFLPGDTMYFVRPDKSDIYRYGSSETDAGQYIDIRWQSGPILGDRNYKSIPKTGCWINNQSDTNEIRVIWWDESDDVMATQHFSPVSDRYNVVSMTPHQFLYAVYRIYSSSWNLDNDISIDGLDIWYKYSGDSPVK